MCSFVWLHFCYSRLFFLSLSSFENFIVGIRCRTNAELFRRTRCCCSSLVRKQKWWTLMAGHPANFPFFYEFLLPWYNKKTSWKCRTFVCSDDVDIDRDNDNDDTDSNIQFYNNARQVYKMQMLIQCDAQCPNNVGSGTQDDRTKMNEKNSKT